MDRRIERFRTPNSESRPSARSKRAFYRKATRLFQCILLLGIALFVTASLYKDKLPSSDGVPDEFYQDPVQKKTRVRSFETDVGDITYTIKPKYAYELYGMVVSTHDSSAWWDIYHHARWKDFINLKDLCVIWGENIGTEIYKEMGFSSTNWTCNYSWPTREVGDIFNHYEISNNHLLSDEEDINSQVRRAERGDQIYLKGYLAEYSHSDNAFRRGTSVTRTDTGNGACETVYLEDFEIIRRANVGWRTSYTVSKYLIMASLCVLLIIFIVRPPTVD